MSPHPPLCLAAVLHPHLFQTELGAIHKILHLPPQSISYNLAINFSDITGFRIRSASTAMNASMIMFALKSFPQAKQINDLLLQATVDCAPLAYVSTEPGLPTTPGWDSPAYVSRLACALRLDNGIGVGLPEFATFLSKMKRRIERNCSIKEVAIQKQLYNILITISKMAGTLLSLRDLLILVFAQIQ